EIGAHIGNTDLDLSLLVPEATLLFPQLTLPRAQFRLLRFNVDERIKEAASSLDCLRIVDGIGVPAQPECDFCRHHAREHQSIIGNIFWRGRTQIIAYADGNVAVI